MRVVKQFWILLLRALLSNRFPSKRVFIARALFVCLATTSILAACRGATGSSVPPFSVQAQSGRTIHVAKTVYLAVMRNSGNAILMRSEGQGGFVIGSRGHILNSVVTAAKSTPTPSPTASPQPTPTPNCAGGVNYVCGARRRDRCTHVVRELRLRGRSNSVLLAQPDSLSAAQRTHRDYLKFGRIC
jgi:hypothetical protein